MARGRGLIWRYYLFRITNTSGFFLPVAIAILQDKGFGLGFVGLAYGVYAFATVGFEIPTGYLGDWLGRRPSLAFGSGVRTLVIGVYPFVDSAAAFLGLHVCWAVGRTFRSGTQDAWLYEILQRRYDESAFARIESRGNVAKLVTDASTALLAGVLYSLDPALPFVATAAIAAVGLPVLYSFPAVEDMAGEADESADTAGARTTDALSVGDAVRMLRLQARRPAVRWVVCYVALFSSVFVVTRIYEQPALRSVGVSVTGLGVLYAGFKLVSAVAAATVGVLQARLGTRGVLVAMVPTSLVAYASIAVEPLLVVPVLFVNRSLATIRGPVWSQYVNDRLANVGRATVLSGASMVIGVVAGVARLVAGWGTARLGAVAFLPWAGVTLSLAAGVLWLAVDPVRTTTEGDDRPTGVPAPTD